MKLIIKIFILFCFFPYLDIIGLGTDTQPNALIFGAIILFSIRQKKINLPIVLLWFLFLISFLLYYKSDASTFFYVKNVFNYLSPPLICFAAYTIFRKLNYDISFRLFMGVILTYMLVGMIQMFVFPNFLTFLVNGSARGILIGGRGVVSLCPEPAFYASMCIFLMVFSLIKFGKKENWIAIPILLFQLVFLSQSATGVLILGCGLTLFFIVQVIRLRIRYAVVAMVMLVAGSYALNTYRASIAHSRIGKLMEEFIDDPWLITQVDGSVGVRLTGAVAPFLAMKHNHFLPMGIGHYREFLTELYTSGRYRKLLSSFVINEKETLGGSANMILYQLGFIGFIFPVVIFLAFRHGIWKNDRQLLAYFLFMVLLFTQIQLMHSMIGFIIGSSLYFTRAKFIPSLK